MSDKSIGDKELELLRFVAERGPLSVAQAVEEFGNPRGLARSTVLTMMERLRQKGHLGRRKDDGIFVYASPIPAEQLLQGVVRTFVENSLSGSVSPFVAYLADSAEVSAEELTELEDLVARLQAKRREP